MQRVRKTKQQRRSLAAIEFSLEQDIRFWAGTSTSTSKPLVSNPGQAVAEGCFIFHVASLHSEIALSI